MGLDNANMIALDIFSGGDGTVGQVEGPRVTISLQARRAILTSPEVQLQFLDAVTVDSGPSGTGDFERDLEASGTPVLQPDRLDVFQINLGKLCNMTCRHCHVDAGPDRTEENMERETVDACLRAIDRTNPRAVDLTGGAPELNPHFEYLVDACVERGKHVMDRCNLTVLLTRRCQHLPAWFAERGVEVICSLPHYRKLGTDAQRGRGAYDKSLRALRLLNKAGYGYGDPARTLTLVTNPVGAYLPGNQASLEGEWKQALAKHHDVCFDRLLTLTNMPMSRYLEWLMETEQVERYLQKLVHAFNASTITGLMCRSVVSVSWDGYLYDCDFNQQLDLRMNLNGHRPHVSNFDVESWRRHVIRTERHCYGCTAGSGSSCGGAIVGS